MTCLWTRSLKVLNLILLKKKIVNKLSIDKNKNVESYLRREIRIVIIIIT